MATNPYFGFLDAMNKGDFAYVDRMEESDVKEIQPFVLTMWVNGSIQNQDIHVRVTDALCNDKIFSLGKHPRLLLKLFIEANRDIDSTRYRIQKVSGVKKDDVSRYLMERYQCSYKDAKDYKHLLSDEEIEKIEEYLKE